MGGLFGGGNGAITGTPLNYRTDMGMSALRNAKKCAFLVWRSKRAYLCTSSECFWIPSMGVFEMRKAKRCAFLACAPGAHMSAPNLPAKGVLDT